MTYCEYLKTISGETLELHKEYHDFHYGFPIDNDYELFERYLSGAHSPDCPVYEKIRKIKELNEKKRQAVK